MEKSRLAMICSVFLSVSLLVSIAANIPAKAALSSSSKFIGNIIAYSVPSNFGNYWNQVTPENATKWGSVESTRGSYNWSNADTIYNYAKKN